MINWEIQSGDCHVDAQVSHVRNKMDSVGLDMLLDIHGDEELPYNFINGNEVCTALNTYWMACLCLCVYMYVGKQRVCRYWQCQCRLQLSVLFVLLLRDLLLLVLLLHCLLLFVRLLHDLAYTVPCKYATKQPTKAPLFVITSVSGLCIYN